MALMIPRLDSGMLLDDMFGGMGMGMNPWLNPSRSLATTGPLSMSTRPLYVDVSEQADKYVMRVDVPGVSKENIQARRRLQDGPRTWTSRCSRVPTCPHSSRRRATSCASGACARRAAGARSGGCLVEPLDSSNSRTAPLRSVSEKQEDERDWNEAGTTWHRVERSSNFSSRALRFPDAADLSKVEASCEGGVLKVNIMKRPESPEGKKQTISVS